MERIKIMHMCRKEGKPMAAFKKSPPGDKSAEELGRTINDANLHITRVAFHGGISIDHVSKVLRKKVKLTMGTQKKIEKGIEEAIKEKK
jgi:hypothetical protein